MLTKILHSETSDALGYSFAGFSLWIKSMDWFHIHDISMIWDFILAIGTGFFLFYKGYNAMLESKGRKLDNELKQRELDEKGKADENI